MVSLGAVTAQERERAEAIRELRVHLGESQQEFSNRLGVAIRTVARYETQKPPRGTILTQLATLSRNAGRHDLAAIFKRAEQTENSSRRSPIAAAIRRLRSALGYTQQELAQKAGLALSTIARYETTDVPDSQALKKLVALARKNNLEDLAQTFEKLTTNLFPAERRPELDKLRTEFNRFLKNPNVDKLAALKTVLEDTNPGPYHDVIAKFAELARTSKLPFLTRIFGEKQDAADELDMQKFTALKCLLISLVTNLTPIKRKQGKLALAMLLHPVEREVEKVERRLPRAFTDLAEDAINLAVGSILREQNPDVYEAYSNYLRSRTMESVLNFIRAVDPSTEKSRTQLLSNMDQEGVSRYLENLKFEADHRAYLKGFLRTTDSTLHIEEPPWDLRTEAISAGIKRLRRELSISEQELSARLGISVTEVKSFELGALEPGPELFAKLAELTRDQLLRHVFERIGDRVRWYERHPTSATVDPSSKGADPGSFGDAIKQLRQELFMSQEEFAAQLGQPVSLLNFYEADLVSPTFDDLAKLVELAAAHQSPILHVLERMRDTPEWIEIPTAPSGPSNVETTQRSGEGYQQPKERRNRSSS